jgi:hypothetical protein
VPEIALSIYATALTSTVERATQAGAEYRVDDELALSMAAGMSASMVPGPFPE